MTHFVSKSCGSEKCVCGKPATHKLGEEIALDEPCMLCGERWRYYDEKDDQGIRVVGVPKNDCKGSYHLFGGPTAQRHNLTSYVCCFHFTLILGAATGCPLDGSDARALAEFKRACTDDGNIFAPTIELRCVACRGPLKIEGANTTNAVVGCMVCSLGYHIENKEA